jgi:hypothetical protein
VPALTPGQQRQIADGRLILDQMSRTFIREHLGYRYAIRPDGTTALAAERAVRADLAVRLLQRGGEKAVPQPAVIACTVAHGEGSPPSRRTLPPFCAISSSLMASS